MVTNLPLTKPDFGNVGIGKKNRCLHVPYFNKSWPLNCRAGFCEGDERVHFGTDKRVEGGVRRGIEGLRGIGNF